MTDFRHNFPFNRGPPGPRDADISGRPQYFPELEWSSDLKWSYYTFIFLKLNFSFKVIFYKLKEKFLTSFVGLAESSAGRKVLLGGVEKMSEIWKGREKLTAEDDVTFSL